MEEKILSNTNRTGNISSDHFIESLEGLAKGFRLYKKAKPRRIYYDLKWLNNPSSLE